MALARRSSLATVGLCLALATPVLGQVRASERGAVSQTIDGTVITVDYARPQLRGRGTIFGGFVKWKEVWTPGANYATTIEVNRNVQLDGHLLRPGKYSMWLVVEPEQWTMVLDPKARLYHTDPPDSSADQVRYIVHPTEGSFTEMLTFEFLNVRPNGATLRLRWGTTQLDTKVAVEPKHRLSMDLADAQPYLGTFLFRWTGDTSPPSKLTFVHEDGMLVGNWVPAPWPAAAKVVLVKIADDWFMVGTLEHGEMTDLMPEFVFEFSRNGGKPAAFEVRGEGDKLEASAKRE
jgi:hypothetical protein